MAFWKDLLKFITTANPDKQSGRHVKSGAHGAPAEGKSCGISDDTKDGVHTHHVCVAKRGHLGKHFCRSWGCTHQW